MAYERVKPTYLSESHSLRRVNNGLGFGSHSLIIVDRFKVKGNVETRADQHAALVHLNSFYNTVRN